jgi:undecaprenyl-phosphate 4-deoxy-4-formamido-L-arabinose transferase
MRPDPAVELRSLPAGISVVIPCYNSEATVSDLTRRLAQVLPTLAAPFELILVNDGSTDGTWAAIEAVTREFSWVRGLDLMRNYGQHNATLCGARAALYDVTVTLDDDLQNPPEEIPKLVAKLGEGFDLVYGTPSSRSHSMVRNIGSWLTRQALVMASGQATVRAISAFRAYRTDLRRAFDDYRSPQVIVDILLTWGTSRIAAVPVTHHERESGQSNYSARRLWSALLMLWTGYTTAPLRLASLLGFACVLFGMGILVYVVTIYYTQRSLPGFPFLASTIAIFGGVQLFALGIVGEYLARLFNRSLDRPTYAVRVLPHDSE